MTLKPLQLFLQLIKVVKHLLNKLYDLLRQVYIPINSILLLLLLPLGLPLSILKYFLPFPSQNIKKPIKINPIIAHTSFHTSPTCLLEPSQNCLNMDLARLKPHAIQKNAQVLDS